MDDQLKEELALWRMENGPDVLDNVYESSGFPEEIRKQLYDVNTRMAALNDEQLLTVLRNAGLL